LQTSEEEELDVPGRDLARAARKARRDQLLVEEVNDELVVFDLERRTVHLLNPVAAFVWRRCDGRTSVAQLASLLHAELGLPANDELILLALDELEKNHLLEEQGAASATTDSLSRRQMIRRLAAATGIGLMLPLVESLRPPAAEAAASTPGCQDQCGTRIDGEPVCEGVNPCPPNSNGPFCREETCPRGGSKYCACVAFA
jgi:Coenzyme PQQ synthesis protein D (PqqD)